MNKTILTAAVAMLISIVHSDALAGDPAEAEKLYKKVCAACHGENGGGSNEVDPASVSGLEYSGQALEVGAVEKLQAPRISGLSSAYLIRQLKYFKSGVRGGNPDDVYGAQMATMAGTLADDQAIEDMVAYIQTLEASAPAPTIEGNVEAGKAAYQVCAACHGPDGMGNEAMNAPRLAGQHDWYLKLELQEYKSGLRGTHPEDSFGAQMRPMAMTLASEEAIDNVVAYLNSLN